MNSLVSGNIETNLEDEQDVLGGGRGPLDSGVYDFMIEAAFTHVSSGGAKGITLHLASPDGKTTHRETVYFTTGQAKGCVNYYERDGERKPLPGWTTLRAVSLLAAGKEPTELTEEEKVIKLYNFDTSTEENTKVNMLTDLLNQPIKVALLKKRENKRVQGDDGKWKPVNEERIVTNIDKVFRARDNFTVHEIIAQAEAPAFMDRWIEKHAGTVRDEYKEQKDAGGAQPMGQAPANAGAGKTSMFG